MALVPIASASAPFSLTYGELSRLETVGKREQLGCPGLFAHFAVWEGVPLAALLAIPPHHGPRATSAEMVGAASAVKLRTDRDRVPTEGRFTQCGFAQLLFLSQ
jgi:hypothetical protein